MTSFRDELVNVVPPWLRRSWGARWMYAFGVAMDLLFEFAIEGVSARFPDLAPDDALPLIASDRGLILGFDEPRESKNLRLRRAIDDTKRAGSPYALLEQLAAYFTGHQIRIGIVTNRGTWHVRDEAGNVTVTRLAGNWDWDGSPARWSRFWVILWPLDGLIEAGPTIGGAWVIGQPGMTIGTTASPSMVSTVREIVRQWKPAGRRCDRIIIALDPDSFDPAAPPGAPLPDGTWRYHERDDGTGVLRPARLESARYWEGTGHMSVETGKP